MKAQTLSCLFYPETFFLILYELFMPKYIDAIPHCCNFVNKHFCGISFKKPDYGQVLNRQWPQLLTQITTILCCFKSLFVVQPTTNIPSRIPFSYEWRLVSFKWIDHFRKLDDSVININQGIHPCLSKNWLFPLHPKWAVVLHEWMIDIFLTEKPSKRQIWFLSLWEHQKEITCNLCHIWNYFCGWI